MTDSKIKSTIFFIFNCNRVRIITLNINNHIDVFFNLQIMLFSKVKWRGGVNFIVSKISAFTLIGIKEPLFVLSNP